MSRRASKFAAIGDNENSEFASDEYELFLSRLFLFRVADIEDLHAPPVAPDPDAVEAQERVTTEGRFKWSSGVLEGIRRFRCLVIWC